MKTEILPSGVIDVDKFAYNGKNYTTPVFNTSCPTIIVPEPEGIVLPGSDHPIMESMNQPFDLERFKQARLPISLGKLSVAELPEFTRWGVQRVLDMPIKMPDDNEYRLPRALQQFEGVISRVVDFEQAINPEVADYFAYLTIDQRVVQGGTLQREAPCHVDGFQGARWSPKVRGNHTYTVSDLLPTAYYIQPFDFDELDEEKHDFFWEMNAQVADTQELHKWSPDDAEITLMDCYNVHRGVAAAKKTPRTWLRLSFEDRSRVFDRLGNAHNPLFDYSWNMVERDIEQLGLVPFRTDVDPSLNVFPWQDLDGSALPNGASRTQPKLS